MITALQCYPIKWKSKNYPKTSMISKMPWCEFYQIHPLRITAQTIPGAWHSLKTSYPLCIWGQCTRFIQIQRCTTDKNSPSRLPMSIMLVPCSPPAKHLVKIEYQGHPTTINTHVSGNNKSNRIQQIRYQMKICIAKEIVTKKINFLGSWSHNIG
jgi:hypothetical protein